jgi:hypothetical protein
VTAERTGQMPERPTDHFLDKTQKQTCDLKPRCSELVSLIRWPIPIRQVGMLAGESALAYGPIKVTVSGDDVKPATKVFRFDYQREPMISTARMRIGVALCILDWAGRLLLN